MWHHKLTSHILVLLVAASMAGFGPIMTFISFCLHETVDMCNSV